MQLLRGHSCQVWCVCIGDDGGVGGEYEIHNVARFDACWVVYHIL